MKKFLLDFLKEEDGMETVEIVILLVVIVGIAFAFRKTLITWYNGFITDSQSQSKVFGTPETGTEFK